MPQTRMFRDRMVSMEQTLEGGEKHLELLKSLCREALPDFEYRSHGLDHERDLFVMTLESSDGRRKNVAWTRMVLFDAERIPALSGDGSHAIRARVVGFLRSRANRPEIVVTFRHLEEGWVEAPEPRRDRKRRRGGRGEARGGRPQSPGPPAQAQKQRGAPAPQPAQRASGPGPGARGIGPATAPHSATAPHRAPSGESPAAAEAGRPEGPRPSGSRRRRFRRRRRGRGGSASGGPPASPARPPGGA